MRNQMLPREKKTNGEKISKEPKNKKSKPRNFTAGKTKCWIKINNGKRGDSNNNNSSKPNILTFIHSSFRLANSPIEPRIRVTEPASPFICNRMRNTKANTFTLEGTFRLKIISQINNKSKPNQNQIETKQQQKEIVF